ncbi:transmembrane protease serine 9-like [Cydia splendana]|uniref:transmembrane protease serine 9-like n=1 Tax=Cydia splendana TaxID=1100963 RepID=UPI002141ECE7
MPNGCQKCWEEFKGWLKAFTPVETFLTILEALLLVVLIVFMVFLILHFLSCRGELESSTLDSDTASNTTTVAPRYSTRRPTGIHNDTTGRKTRPTCTYTKEQKSTLATTSANETTASSSPYSTDVPITYATPTHPDQIVSIESDGELAVEDERRHVMALVKIKPSGVTFGCILTVVAERWVLTAASCLDSIEEVDSLDNFVIMDNYDALNKGRSHAVSDVRVHPLYEGGNKSYDLALLRSEDGLDRPPVKIASLLIYFKLPMGEAGNILGFGRFRTIDHSVPQQVHSAVVHILPSSLCMSPETLSLERHLIPLEPVAHGRCGLAPLCLGVLHARGAPCNFCAGAPLLRAGTLLAVMADNEQCGAACEPALYANVAAHQQWIHASAS